MSALHGSATKPLTIGARNFYTGLAARGVFAGSDGFVMIDEQADTDRIIDYWLTT